MSTTRRPVGKPRYRWLRAWLVVATLSACSDQTSSGTTAGAPQLGVRRDAGDTLDAASREPARDAAAEAADRARDAADATPSGVSWQPLFNGVDFSGWDRYLGKPSAA